MESRNVLVATMASAVVAVCLTIAADPAMGATISWGSPLTGAERGEAAVAESPLWGDDLLFTASAAVGVPCSVAALMAGKSPELGGGLMVTAEAGEGQSSPSWVAELYSATGSVSGFPADYRSLMEPLGDTLGMTIPGQLIVEPMVSDLSEQMPLHQFAIQD